MQISFLTFSNILCNISFFLYLCTNMTWSTHWIFKTGSKGRCTFIQKYSRFFNTDKEIKVRTCRQNFSYIFISRQLTENLFSYKDNLYSKDEDYSGICFFVLMNHTVKIHAFGFITKQFSMDNRINVFHLKSTDQKYKWS